MLNDSKILASKNTEISSKASQSTCVDAIALNEVVVTPLVPDVLFVLGTDLYDVESTNTTEARVQAAAAGVGAAQTNVFSVQKTGDESLTQALVPSGQLLLSQVVTDNTGTKQIQQGPLVAIFFKQQIQ